MRNAILVIITVALAPPVSYAGQTSSVCGDILSPRFLVCVGELIDAAKTQGQGKIGSQLRDALIYMAETEDYEGAIGDIEKPKYGLTH